MWKPGGIFTVTTEPWHEYPELIACRDGSLFLFNEMSYQHNEKTIRTRGILQIYDEHGRRKDRWRGDGLQVSDNVHGIEICEAGDDGVWVVVYEYSNGRRDLLYNRIQTDGSMLFRDNETLDIYDFHDLRDVKVASIPDGGLIVLNTNSMQYVLKDGKQKWSLGKTRLDSSLGVVLKIIPDYKTQTCYVLIMNRFYDMDRATAKLKGEIRQEGILYSVIKIRLGEKPEIVWHSPLSRYFPSPENRYNNPPGRFEKGCFDGEYLFFADRDTLWKMDKDGNQLFGQAGKPLLQDIDPNKFHINELTTTVDGNLLLRGYLNRINVMKIDPSGELNWDDRYICPFPERRGNGIGLTQLDDTTLRFASYDSKGISIQDFTFDGVLRYPMNGRRIIEFEKSSSRGLVRASVKSSGRNMVFSMSRSTAESSGPSSIQFCDYNLNLFPDKPICPQSEKVNYPSHPFTDHHDGWWFYYYDYSRPKPGFTVNHVDESGSRWDEGPLPLFEDIQCNWRSSCRDLDAYDGDRGHWFIVFDDKKNMWAQKVYIDRTLHFKNGPRKFPFKWRDRNDKVIASANGSLFLIREMKDLEQFHFNYKIFKLDENLESVWSEPIQVFAEPVSVDPGNDRLAVHFETSIARSDGGLWVLERFKQRHPEFRGSYAENRLQLISADGERLLAPQGMVFPMEKETRGGMGNSVSTVIPDNHDGIWVIWDDYITERVKATYLSTDLEFPSPYCSKDGIYLVNADRSHLGKIDPYLCDDNSLVVSLYRNNSSAMVVQRLSIKP